MLEKILEKLGLSEKESKVYLATLELAQDSVQNIAKKAGVNRPTAYFVLEHLMELGLVSTLEHGKKTLFVAENPKELESLLENEKQEIENRKIELKESMNQLLAIYNAKQGKPAVRYFEGKEGLVALDKYGEERVKKGSTIYYLLPVDLLGKYFPVRRTDAMRERIAHKVWSKVIYTYSDKSQIQSASKDKEELRIAKYIPRDRCPFDVLISIYPDDLIKFYYIDEIHPYGVAIESADFARNMRMFFELAWLGADKL